jgi:hypothetical protein
MNFLRNNAQHESVEAPGLDQTRRNAPAAPSRKLDLVLIATQILELAVTPSKQTTATCSNRHFFGTFRAASHTYCPQPSRRFALSNRKIPILEPHLTHTKQSIDTVSNRPKMHVCVLESPANSAANFQSAFADGIPRA